MSWAELKGEILHCVSCKKALKIDWEEHKYYQISDQSILEQANLRMEYRSGSPEDDFLYDYLLIPEEVDEVISYLDQIDKKEWKEFFSELAWSSRQYQFTYDFLRKNFEVVIRHRPKSAEPYTDEAVDFLVELSENAPKLLDNNVVCPNSE